MGKIKLALALILFLMLLHPAGAREEMRVVPAQEILDKIERGEPVEYDHVIVEGDLDLGKVELQRTNLKDLENVELPRTNVNISFIRGLLGLGYPLLVSSSIEIIDSVIQGNVSFSNAVFSNRISFKDSHFNGNTNFYGSTFDHSANFRSSAFSGTAYFGLSAFNGSALFSLTTFNGISYFGGSLFKGTASFRDTIFNGTALFAGSTFNGNANFLNTTFNDEIYFGGSLFNKEADFENTTFRNTIEFGSSTFDEKANFKGSIFDIDAAFDDSNFNDVADFRDSAFNGLADFGSTAFNGIAGFNGAAFNSSDFSSAEFNKTVYFTDANFSNSTSFNASLFREDPFFEGAFFNGPLFFTRAKYDRLYIRWKNIKDLGYDDVAYLALLENFKKLGYVEDYDACYYEYRRLHRDQPWSGGYHAMQPWEEWLLKRIDLGLQAFYGYGKKPIWPLLWSAGTILLFGLIWRRAGVNGGRSRGGIFERFSPGGEKKEKISHKEQLRALGGAMLFSATLFLSGTRLFVDPPAMPKLEGWLAAHVRTFFIAERVLGAFFSILFFLAVSGTVVR